MRFLICEDGKRGTMKKQRHFSSTVREARGNLPGLGRRRKAKAVKSGGGNGKQGIGRGRKVEVDLSEREGGHEEG